MVMQKRRPSLVRASAVVSETEAQAMLQRASSKRSVEEFYSQEEQFLRRKDRWRKDQIRNQVKLHEDQANTKKISKNSERIWGDSLKRGRSIYSQVSGSNGRLLESANGDSPESMKHAPFSDPQTREDNGQFTALESRARSSLSSQPSVKFFLDRNYHTIQGQKDLVMRKASEKAAQHFQLQRARHSQSYRTLDSAQKSRSPAQNGDAILSDQRSRESSVALKSQDR